MSYQISYTDVEKYSLSFTDVSKYSVVEYVETPPTPTTDNVWDDDENWNDDENWEDYVA